MLELKDLFYFVQVVDRGGFSAAGRILGVPKSTLSHRIHELENTLGIRLVNRTSRRFVMTETGRTFYDNALATLRQAEIAETSARQHLSKPSGVIRISSSVAIARFALCDLIPPFLVRFPEVRIIHQATDVQIDLVAEGYDLALRGHASTLPNSTMIQRKIASIPWYLFAQTDYLKTRGAPLTPVDLAEHAIIALSNDLAGGWRLRDSRQQEVLVPIEPSFSSNDMILLKQAACAGLGSCLCQLTSAEKRSKPVCFAEFFQHGSRRTRLSRHSFPSVEAFYPPCVFWSIILR